MNAAFIQKAGGLADGKAGGGGGGLDPPDPQAPEGEPARPQDRIGTRFRGGREVLEPAGSATGDDRYADGGTDRPDHLEVVPVLGAVGVHGVEQDLSSAELRCAGRPCDGVDAGAVTTAVGGHLEPALGPVSASSVDGQHQDLVAEPVSDLADELGPGNGCGVDPHLVGAGAQQPVDVVG